MRFTDRHYAGQLLAERILRYLSQHGLRDSKEIIVVGLPRGGVPVAYEVAQRLNCPLEILVSKKLPYPGQPEYAIGAVSSDGIVIVNPDIPNTEDWKYYVEQQRRRLLYQTAEIEERFYKESGRSGLKDFKNKVVIVIDDGVATGMTALAALETSRTRGARMTIAAAPVMSSDSFVELGQHADAVVSVAVPENLQSVGFHYVNFTQTTNEEVVEALRASSKFGINGQSLQLNITGN